MKDETKKWLEYADENLRSAGLLLGSDLFNPYLQNVQQAVEKTFVLECVFKPGGNCERQIFRQVYRS
jgi:HEPN domain-containing protein